MTEEVFVGLGTSFSSFSVLEMVKTKGLASRGASECVPTFFDWGDVSLPLERKV